MPEGEGGGGGGVGRTLGHKVGPLPVWGWLALGGGGVVLFVWLSGRGAQPVAAGSMGYVAPTTDQLSGQQLAAIQGSLQDMQSGMSDQMTAWVATQTDLINALIDKENDQMTALIGAQSDASAAYQSQLAAFLDALKAMLAAAPPNQPPAPTTGSSPPPAGDPLAGAQQWLKDRLQAPYWQARKYVLRSDTNLGDQYSAAVNAFFRSDTASGLNSDPAAASQAAQAQLAHLIASGQAALNPLYHG